MTEDAAPFARMISDTTHAFFADMSKGQMYLEEAEFGLRNILPVLQDLPSGARVLEVGSGPCIVLSEIVRRFPDLDIQGIEPMSDGFAFFHDFIDRMQSTHGGLNVHLGGYESFATNTKWDLIFLVNVFEHLPDWRDFLGFVRNTLSACGQCVVLCPNYGFPYESHFKLPVILNKHLTQKVFRQSIARFEEANDNDGLYKSLNFVTLKQVRRAAVTQDLALSVDTRIIRDMINRLDHDPAFQERQKVLAWPARFLKKSGLLEPMLGSRWIQNVLPYMQFHLTRA